MLTSVVLAENRAVAPVAIHDAAGHPVILYEASHALVIGVSEHTGGWPDLPGVKADVEAVSKVLEAHGFTVTRSMNPDHHHLDRVLREFTSRKGLKAHDRLLIYFAGHGHTVRKRFGGEMGYLVPADAPDPNHDLSGFLEKALPMERIDVFAKTIESKHALFIFDSCFSGLIFAQFRAVPEIISYKTAKPVRLFITSGSADEKVLDKSIFRQELVAALSGEADIDRDRYVTGTELGKFVQERVIRGSKGMQHPQYGKILDPRLSKGDIVFQLPPGSDGPSSVPARPPPGSDGPSSVPARPPSNGDRPRDLVLQALKDAVNSWCDAQACGFRTALANEDVGALKSPTLVLADVITSIGSLRRGNAQRVTLTFKYRLSTRPTGSTTADLVYRTTLYSSSELTEKAALEEAAMKFRTYKEKTFNSVLIDGLNNIKDEVASVKAIRRPLNLGSEL